MQLQLSDGKIVKTVTALLEIIHNDYQYKGFMFLHYLNIKKAVEA